MAEETRQGRDATTLEVVIEAAGPLTCDQLEGLVVHAGQAHPKATGLSHPSAAMAVQDAHGGGLAAPLTLASHG